MILVISCSESGGWRISGVDIFSRDYGNADGSL